MVEWKFQYVTRMDLNLVHNFVHVTNYDYKTKQKFVYDFQNNFLNIQTLPFFGSIAIFRHNLLAINLE